MDIFDYAMKFEKDGEKYYREIASKTGDKGLATIMNMLADEEVRHFNILSEMKSRSPKVPETDILQKVKNVFEQKADEPGYFDPKEDQIELYRRAQELEKQSEDFYREKAAEVSDPEQKAVLEKIADEEKRHWFVLENIIQFVMRPKIWLNDREFGNLDKY